MPQPERHPETSFFSSDQIDAQVRHFDLICQVDGQTWSEFFADRYADLEMAGMLIPLLTEEEMRGPRETIGALVPQLRAAEESGEDMEELKRLVSEQFMLLGFYAEQDQLIREHGPAGRLMRALREIDKREEEEDTHE